MPAQRQDTLFAFLLAVWAGLYLWSVVNFATTLPAVADVGRTFNRATTFLLWQFAAGAVSIPVFIVGRGYDRGSPLRWLGHVPLLLALALVIFVIGVAAWARVGG